MVGDDACVATLFADQHTQQRGFAGAVAGDDGYALSLFDAERDVVEQQVVAESFAQMFCLQINHNRCAVISNEN